MKLSGDNPRKWLNEFCKGADCSRLVLADLIYQFQWEAIGGGDREKLLQCLICSSNAVWRKWNATVRIFPYDDQKMADFLETCFARAAETIHWLDFDRMDHHGNDDFKKVFNTQMGLVLRGRKINFVPEQIISVSSFIDTAIEFEILSEDQIEEIDRLAGEQEKAKRIATIINEDILSDASFYERMKDKMAASNLALDDFSQTLLLKIISSNPGRKKGKTRTRALNRGLILAIFKKSIVGVKDPLRINAGDDGPAFEPPVSEASRKLSIILELLEDDAFIQKNRTDVDAVMSFLRCLLVEYGQRYRVGEFVIESILQETAKTARARQQKGRFVDRITPASTDGYIDKNHFIFKNCHGRPYADLLCIDGGPAFIVSGIEKALHLRLIEFTEYEIGQFR